ncbi:10447_t:CDS:2, partial [Paraglomus brasilianum]
MQGRKKKKPPSSMTLYQRKLQEEERSSIEVDEFFSKSSGEALKGEKGSPYRACTLHAEASKFDGMTILNRITEIVSDEEEGNEVPKPSENTTHQQPTTTKTQEVEVRISPMGSPELQALLNRKEGSTPLDPIQSTASLTSSLVYTCEIEGCSNTANYEARIENKNGLATARVCVEHATDNIEGNETKSLTLTNTENMSAYSMSSISLSDNEDNDKVKHIVNKVLNTKGKPSYQTKGQKRNKGRRTSNPTQKQAVSFDINSDEDFPSLPGQRTSTKTSSQNVGIAPPKGDTRKGPSPKRARTNKQPSNPVTMNIDSSSEDEVPSRFNRAIIPKIDHPTPFPKKPTNANALILAIDGEPVGVSLKWAPIHLLKAVAGND